MILLCRKPGLKDNNFQVLGLRLSALSQVAQVINLILCTVYL